MTRQLAEHEYRASTNEKGLQAPNRRHNLRTYFEPTGIRVHDRSAAGEPRLLGLSLVGVGRGDALEAVPPGNVVEDGARVEIQRPGLVEWYWNGPEGLEQGFTVNKRPSGDGPLVVALELSGAQAEFVNSRVEIESDTGRSLVYDKIVVEDADGAPVEAHLEVPAANRIALVVHERTARYPLTIDPVLSNPPDSELESDDGLAFFGTSVAGVGDVDGDGYDDVIIGAEEYDAGLIKEGSAFLFLGGASGIASGDASTADAHIRGNQSGALLGSSVAGAGDVDGDGYADVIIGASAYDDGQIDEGAAFLFLGSSSGIASGDPSSADTEFYSDQAAAFLGGSVAAAGDVDGDGYGDVIIGAEQWTNGHFNEGGAFVFLGSSSGIANGTPGTAHRSIEANQIGALLGEEVSGAGDVNGDGYGDVIVGAQLYEFGETDEGLAAVFHGSATGISGCSSPCDAFLDADARLQSNQGSAKFGSAVSCAGDVDDDGYGDVIVGAEFWDATFLNDEGGAFIFYGSASGIGHKDPSTAGVTELEATQVDSLFGASAAGVGDVSGDGIDDVMVGAPFWGVIPEFHEGAAFLFLGSASGIADGDTTSADSQLGLNGNLDDSLLGSAVASAGDVDGDDGADVIIGAEEYDAGLAEAGDDDGAAFIFHGTAVVDSDARWVAACALPVPEPTQLVLLMSGIAGLLALGRNRIAP